MSDILFDTTYRIQRTTCNRHPVNPVNPVKSLPSILTRVIVGQDYRMNRII